jgi:hypothetical protein
LVTFDGSIPSSNFALASIPIFFNCLPFLFYFFIHFLNFHLPYNACVIFVLLFLLLFWETFKTSLIPSGDHGWLKSTKDWTMIWKECPHLPSTCIRVDQLGAGGQWDR